MPTVNFRKSGLNRGEYERKQPGMTFSLHHDLKQETFSEFQKALRSGSETEMHKILAKTPEYLYFALANTGHHGMWYKSKPQIRPPLVNGKKGHIPDFLVCGDNSHGSQWFVIELKAPNSTLFNKPGTALSSDANQGIIQLIQYVAYINKNLPTISQTLEIPNLLPVKGLLLIGNEEETPNNSLKAILKGDLIRHLNDIDIVSFSRIFHGATEHFQHTTKVKIENKRGA